MSLHGKDCIVIINIVSLIGPEYGDCQTPIVIIIAEHGDCQDTCRNNNYSIFDSAAARGLSDIYHHNNYSIFD